MISKISTSKFIFLSLVLFIVALLASRQLQNSNSESNNSPDPFNVRSSPTELALVFFGCSTCPAATDEKIPESLSALSERLETVAIQKKINYISIGISNERNIRKGINYLNSIAEFDEIALGNGMGNISLQRYVWDNFNNPYAASAPQIILVKRIYETRVHNSNKEINPRIVSEEILFRHIGLEQISNKIINTLINQL